MLPRMIPRYNPNDSEYGLKLLEDLTTNAYEVQQRVLEEILVKNAQTEYLKGFLNGHHDKKDFKNKVPVVNYEDVKPYIERIANGETSEIISAQKITELLTSSGTSGGQPKMMPSTVEDLDRKTFFYNLLVPVMNKYVDGLDQGKGMYLLFIKPEISTPSGLVARPFYQSSFYTVYTGLYRYRVGDILMVTGFHNKAPQFRFMHRRNVVLSIDTDKTNEEDLLNAVTQAKLLLEPLGFLLIEYTSYADTSSIPGHYVLFWELKTKENNHTMELETIIMEQCCSTVEQSLDSVYRRCRRKDNSIGPLEIRIVQHGTFDALMDFSVSQGSSVNQYKTPRCIQSEEAIRILDSRVVGRFFSKSTPLWEPFRIETQ
ncbi:unnamed protein product [Malus baccata var. baccata]